MTEERKPVKLLLSENDRIIMKRAADAVSLPLATWARMTLLKAAKEQASEN